MQKSISKVIFWHGYAFRATVMTIGQKCDMFTSDCAA